MYRKGVFQNATRNNLHLNLFLLWHLQVLQSTEAGTGGVLNAGQKPTIKEPLELLMQLNGMAQTLGHGVSDGMQKVAVG